MVRIRRIENKGPNPVHPGGLGTRSVSVLRHASTAFHRFCDDVRVATPIRRAGRGTRPAARQGVEQIGRCRCVPPALPGFSLEEATVVSQGREPLGTGCVPHTKSPEGAAETSIVLSPLRGLAICRIPVQGLTPLANNCRLFEAKDRRQRNLHTVASAIQRPRAENRQDREVIQSALLNAPARAFPRWRVRRARPATSRSSLCPPASIRPRWSRDVLQRSSWPRASRARFPRVIWWSGTARTRDQSDLRECRVHCRPP